jgi:hypothetical protein
MVSRNLDSINIYSELMATRFPVGMSINNHR